jgi:hypothetical protein
VLLGAVPGVWEDPGEAPACRKGCCGYPLCSRTARMWERRGQGEVKEMGGGEEGLRGDDERLERSEIRGNGEAAWPLYLVIHSSSMSGL